MQVFEPERFLRLEPYSTAAFAPDRSRYDAVAILMVGNTTESGQAGTPKSETTAVVGLVTKRGYRPVRVQGVIVVITEGERDDLGRLESWRDKWFGERSWG